MKSYKILTDDSSVFNQNEFYYKELGKAKTFVIDRLNKKIQSILNDTNNENPKGIPPDYFIKKYTDNELKIFSVSHGSYSQSATVVDDYIIEIVDNLFGRTRYIYQFEYGFVENRTDFICNIIIEEINLIE